MDNFFHALIVLLLLPLGILLITQMNVALTALLVLLPFAHSNLIPRQMLGITGLNPFNLIVMALIFAIFYNASRISKEVVLPQFKPLIYAYLLPIVVSALYGITRIGEISPYFISSQYLLREESPVEVDSVAGYLSAMLIKPLILILMAYLLAVCIASFRIESRVRSILFGVFALVPVSLIVGLIVQGLGLGDISTSQDRGALSWYGMHANELGLMLNIAFAMALFGIFHGQIDFFRMKFGLALVSLLSIGIVITFSRGAYLAYFVTIMLFWARQGIKPAQLLLVPLFLAALFFLPDAVYERLFTGVANRDIGDVSAGRVDLIWIPLIPTAFDNLFFGNGLGSVMWSVPMQLGQILPVGHPHSAYLGLLLDFGVVGASLILYFWWRVWGLFDDLALVNRDWRGFFIGGKVAIVTLAVQGLTDDRFTPTYSQAFLWVAIGLAMGMSHTRLCQFNRTK